MSFTLDRNVQTFVFHAGTLHFLWYNLVGTLPMVQFFGVNRQVAQRYLLCYKMFMLAVVT